MLPSRLRRRVNALQSVVVPMTGGDPLVDPRTLTIIAAACRDHAPAERVRQVVAPAAGQVEPVDEHSCVLHVGGPNLDVIPIHLAQLGFEFTVHEPPELIEQVRRLAGMFGRATGYGPVLLTC